MKVGRGEVGWGVGECQENVEPCEELDCYSVEGSFNRRVTRTDLEF